MNAFYYSMIVFVVFEEAVLVDFESLLLLPVCFAAHSKYLPTTSLITI